MAVRRERIRQCAAGRSPLDLALAALWTARVETPRLPVQGYLRRIQELATRAGRGVGLQAAVGDRLFALNTTLFDDMGFVVAGDYRPEQCLLNRVVDTRKASPAAFVTLYLSIGRLLGLPLDGAAVAGRLLVRIRGADLIIDPVLGGTLLNREDLALLLLQAESPVQASVSAIDRQLERGDDRRLLVRLMSELKAAYTEHGELEKALDVSDCLLVVAPRAAWVHRDRARLLERLECHHAARADYRRYLELAPKAADSDSVARRVEQLGRRDVTLH